MQLPDDVIDTLLEEVNGDGVTTRTPARIANSN
jgi:hypothetical protein